MSAPGLTYPTLTFMLALGTAAGVVAAQRRLRLPQRLAVATVAFVVTSAMVQSLLVYANTTWNSVRTVVPAAWASGVPPAFPPGDGPLWASIYPPLAYVFQLPLAWMPTPQSMVWAGQTLSVVLLAVPLGLMLHRWGTAGGALGAGVAWVAAAAAVFSLPGLASAALTVHVDAPATSMGLLATLAALHPARPLRSALLAGGLAAASVLCKQTMLPLVGLLVAVIAVGHGRQGVGVFLLGFAGTGVVLLGLLLTQMSPAGLWHNAFTVPSRHPWRDDTASPLMTATFAAFTSLWPLWLAAPVLGTLAWRGSSLPARPVAVLLLGAMALLPAGVAGYAKFGGHVNNFAPSGFFLLAAAMLLLSSVAVSRQGRLSPAGTVALVLAALASAHRLQEVYRRGPVIPLHDQAAELVRTAPGRIYLPWHPLAHFVVEGRLTHQSFGVLDREKAGEVVSDDWLRRYMPPDAEVLGFDYPPRLPPDPMADRLFERLRDEFPLPASVPGFPGWTFFARERP